MSLRTGRQSTKMGLSCSQSLAGQFIVKERLQQFWKGLPPKRRKLVLWAGGAVLFYTVVGFLLLPLIIRAVAVKRLGKELNREVTIKAVRLNPYALSCSIQGLLIKDHDGQPFV